MSELTRVVEILAGAGRVVVLTGAGMSAESGVPTFRDALDGFWSHFDPQELATPGAFDENPSRVFGWYLSRLRAIRRVEPHPGYDALVTMENHFGALPVVTQNVDGMHQRSGSAHVVELHGSLTRFVCRDQGHPYPLDKVIALGESEHEEVPPPECESCGDLVRPGVVWFGEALPEDAVRSATELVEEADVVLVVGTSSVVYPAAELPYRAMAAGARVIEVNPDETPLSARVDVSWRDKAGHALSLLSDRLATDGARA